ncbi:putative reverse transcriptase domain-containing protein [Tanacetum coccineum]
MSTLGSRYKIGESSTARPTRDRGVDYGFVSTVDAEVRRQGIIEVGVTELAELHEHDTQDLYASLEDAQDRLSQATHQELQTYHDHVYAHETHIGSTAQLQLLSEWMRRHETEIVTCKPELLAYGEQQRRAFKTGPDQCWDSQITRMLWGYSHGDDRRNVQTARPCFYADFMKCQPLNFKGTEGVVGLTRWIEKMESVFNISGCAIENQVKFATYTLLGAALTWWNGQIRTLGPKAYSMTWEVLKKKMTDKYYPQGKIKKLEIELWNLKVKGNDVSAYTERFQELTQICTKFVSNETKKVDKYISGLPDNIYRNVKSARLKTLDETIELANDLMDQKLRTYAERQSDNKRKADDSSRNNHGHQQQPFKRQNVAKVYNMGTCEKKPYGGSLPKTFQEDCPKLKNKDEEMGVTSWVYAVWNAEKKECSRDPRDSNVVTGTFILNNHYVSILFDTDADRSFIFTAFSSLIDIAPTPLENSYDVELADGKIVGINTII